MSLAPTGIASLGFELFHQGRIDVQPSGDKKNTTLHLEVRFDKLLARTLIELPN